MGFRSVDKTIDFPSISRENGYASIMQGQKFLLSLLLFSLVMPEPAFAKVKKGSTCAKLGKTIAVDGLKLVCTQAGRKKIYRVANPAIPKPESSPTPSVPGDVKQIPKASLSGNIADQAYMSLKDYLSKQPALAGTKVFMELSPLASVPLSNSTLLDMQEGFRFWQNYTAASTGIHMVFADREDLKWYETKMNQIQSGNESWLPRILNLASANKEAAYAGANGRDSQGNALFFYLPGKFTQADSAGWLGVGPHEWTHFAQNVMTGDIRNAPCWFKEGQATYYGNAISNNDKTKWPAAWKQQINTLYTDYPRFWELSEAKLLEWFKSHELNMPNDVCGPDGAFIIGGIATEYLVGTIGIEGVNNFMLLIGNGKDWKSAFTEVSGKSYEDQMAAIVQFVIQQRDWAKSK